MDLGLSGKTVMVSGVTGAIGEAICEAFLREGAVVVALHRGGRERLAGLLGRTADAGLDPAAILPVETDLTDGDALEEAVDSVIGARGGIDVLVNNAGVTLEAPFLATSEPKARKVVEVNLWGTMRLTRIVLKPMLLARSGSVVTITSVVARRGGRGVSIYASSKAALETLTRSLAVEMAPKGIRVNAVAPGVIATKMSERLRHRRTDRLLARVPMERVGKPAELAPTVLFLSSDRAAPYTTGQVLVVDGGLSL